MTSWITFGSVRNSLALVVVEDTDVQDITRAT